MDVQETERRLQEEPSPSTLERIASHDRQLAKIMKLPLPHVDTILVPVYLRAYMTELVSVSAQDEKIKARFTLYLTIPKNISPDVFKSLELSNTVEQNGLFDFISNNLSLECGDQHIDIISPASASTLENSSHANLCNANRVCLSQTVIPETSQQIHSQQEEEDEETYNESFFVTDQSWLHGNQYLTWVVEGVFDCDYELNNTFFPCMTINSGLKITIHQQKYHLIDIKYEFMRCLSGNNMGIKIFDFKFYRNQHKSFGIYTLNLNSISCKLEDTQKDSEELLQNQQKRISFYMEQAANFKQLPPQEGKNIKEIYQKQLKVAQLGFQVLSFNVPFILRYQIPIWTLCFASIMLYFANSQSISNVFANIILISVSEISLFSSFRMGNFKTDNISMYEVSLASCLTVSLLLLIDSTDNFYSLPLQQQISGPQPNYNAWTDFFYTAVSLCGASLLCNIIALIYKGIMTKSLSFNHHLERNHRLCLTWNEDIFKEFFVLAGLTKQNQTKS